MKTIGRLLGFLRPSLGEAALSILLATATVASGIGMLGTSSYMISAAALHPSIAVLQVAIVGVRFFGISRGVLRYLERLVSHSVNFRLLSGLRVWFYQRIEPLAPARLNDWSSGDLLGRLVGDIETLENFYIRVVAPPVTAALVVVGLGLFVGSLHPLPGLVLTFGLLITGLLIPLLTYLISRRFGRAWINVRAQLNSAWVEGVQALADLTAFGRAEEYFAGLRRSQAEYARLQLRMAWANGLTAALNLLLTNLTLLAVLYVSIPLVRSGELPGVLLAVVAMLTLAGFEGVTPLGQAAQTLESSLTAAERVFEAADAQPLVFEPSSPLPAPTAPGLSVRGLSFRYRPDLPWTLQDLSFDLPAGRRLALVGPSGAGKTTLLHILLRFWEYERGSICLDGGELRNFRAADVRRQMGVIAQSAYFFGGSLRENLHLAHPGAGDGMLAQTLQQVQLGDWLAQLPYGLDTWVGERGLTLSTGERRRLALARMLLQDAPLVLLDEPTSGLDAITERSLLRTLEPALAGRSVLWITHRLIGLENMHEILVLQEGRVVERGNQAELLAHGGLFARMAQIQNRLLPEDDL